MRWIFTRPNLPRSLVVVGGFESRHRVLLETRGQRRRQHVSARDQPNVPAMTTCRDPLQATWVMLLLIAYWGFAPPEWSITVTEQPDTRSTPPAGIPMGYVTFLGSLNTIPRESSEEPMTLPDESSMSTRANTTVGSSLFVEAVTSANSVAFVMSMLVSVSVRHVTDAETGGPLEQEIPNPTSRATSATDRADRTMLRTLHRRVHLAGPGSVRPTFCVRRRHPVEVPAVGDTLELVLAGILEDET
jgi:hypothetical protein